MTARPAMIRVELIDAHPENVRQDLGDLTGLAVSIKTNGLLQPVTVQPNNGRYIMVAGHRRLAACRLVKMRAIPAIVRDDLSETQVVSAMIVENLQRQALNPIEEAKACRRLREMGMTQVQIAAQVGKTDAWVSARESLLMLSETEQQQVIDGTLRIGEAEEQVVVKRRVAAGKPPDKKMSRGWDNSPWHLGKTHPLAIGVEHLCNKLGHNHRRLLRETGCGACWEEVIRADERRKVEARLATDIG